MLTEREQRAKAEERKKRKAVLASRPTHTKRPCGPQAAAKASKGAKKKKEKRSCKTNRALKFTKLGKASGVAVSVASIPFNH